LHASTTAAESPETVSRTRNLHQLLDDAANAAPQATAIRDGNGSWTYAEFAAFSRAFAAWLAGRGVAPGDRVLIQLPNSRELAAMFFGCSRQAAVFVPINPGMKPFHLRSVLGNSEPVLAIVADGRAEAIREHADIDVCEFSAVWPSVAAVGTDASDASVVGDASGQVDVCPEDIAVLNYTSGSTAAPKAVICPQAQMVFAATAINSMLGYRSGDVVLCRLPFSFDYGLYQILLCCISCAELVIADTESDLTLLRLIRSAGVTVVPLVPSLASILISLSRRDQAATKVRLFTNTGAALPQSSIDALRSQFPGARIARMFGITECKRVSIMPPESEIDRPASVGLPLPGTEVVILDPEEGTPLPPGSSGEIVVRGPNVMAGYWRAPEVTASTFRKDPLTGVVSLHTGDYGYLDEGGYLYFEGRRDDMFKHKSVRMSTIEIEAAATDIPGVHGAVVVPPENGGELTICVATELAPKVVLLELAARLEAAKVPTVCHVMEQIPLTPNGKYQRKLSELLKESDRANR
jgi:acyl-CoA synthetase (AMP-forming)/AMP-acid ligase II